MKRVIEIGGKEFWDTSVLMDLFGVSKTTVNDWTAKKVLPEPIWFGARRFWERTGIENIFVLDPPEK